MALSRKQKKAFLTAVVTAGVYLSFRYLLPLIFPFLAAYLMALLLQPSAAFLEKRLRISFRGRMIGVPIGMIGGVELILLSIFLVGLLAAGGRRFTEELEHFLEELPGRMEELSLLGQQFEQSIERVLHLPAGKIGQLFRGTGLQGGGQGDPAAAAPSEISSCCGGDCARGYCGCFIFHCLDFEFTGDGRTAPEAV